MYSFAPLIIAFLKIATRAISLQKVHLWMEISADCPNRGRRSLTKMDSPRNFQTSVWTLQQILSDRLHIIQLPLSAWYHFSIMSAIFLCIVLRPAAQMGPAR